MSASLSIARAKAEDGATQELLLELQRLLYLVMGDVAMLAEQMLLAPRTAVELMRRS